ncbi:MAG: glycoside hydrolase family 2 [Saprospiraceae bacterium]|nr:glycoside hydrolase family 2 [Saprospiraceae bacterium]
MKTNLTALLLFVCIHLFAQNIPLPEHPRPDFERANWLNLNGVWDFEFDSLQVGMSKGWQNGKTTFSKKINVPFPWGSALSGVKDEADFAWYKRTITIPKSWANQRIFVTVGASDWETTVWLDGVLVGKHQGGYTPFSFELTGNAKFDTPQYLVIRVDDKRRDFTLYGKQGYGNARGLWQTVYLEGRGKTHIEAVRFSPDIDKNTVRAEVSLSNALKSDAEMTFKIKTPTETIVQKYPLSKGVLSDSKDIETVLFDIPIPNARLWTLDDPYLYDTEISIGDDVVKTYFGMRKISVVNLPNTTFPYIALNNKPIYLQLTLDQSYHPEGFYTFPSDGFMKNEIKLCKDIGLNGLRTHIKIDIPRKLYWADKLGLLIMSDLPNFWGEPDAKAQAESDYTLREMIKRDFNHPSIFSWITFNETWGLRTAVAINGKTEHHYLPKTQNWVASMYYLAKSLDPTRLVEDNSICCGRGHTETDINSWHEYLPGWAWEEHLSKIDKNTFEGSTHHFEKGFKQVNQPNINSECGNVWGYDGSTGDVDWSYDYHRMMNTFRKYPKVAGWLYTEHHDVINEWNGYWRFDRTKKFTGLDELVAGMTDKDFHSDFYISTGNDICKTVKDNETFDIPLWLSVMSDKNVENNTLLLEYTVDFMDKTGETRTLTTQTQTIPYQAWQQKQLNSLSIKAPEMAGLGIVKMVLKDAKGTVFHHNFFHFIVKSNQNALNVSVFEVKAKDYKNAQFSIKKWDAMEGLKVNGAGKGYFEYHIPIAKSAKMGKKQTAYVLFEASAKQLFDKDKSADFDKNQDYMLGARVSPHKNPNAYPMTDEQKTPSVISIFINGKKSKTMTLADDPADHRGVLSWHNQLKDRKLREAGSYGYLVKVPITKEDFDAASKKGFLTLKIQADTEGGLAIYGEDFGRYPINPSVVVK